MAPSAPLSPDLPPFGHEPFAGLDRAAVGRALSQLVDRPGDAADAFFERSEEIELPPDDRPPGVRVRREEGLAVRLLRGGGDGSRGGRGGESWMAARDALSREAFTDALRQAARVVPTAAYPQPPLEPAPWPGPAEAPEVLAFPAAVQRAVRARRSAFPVALTVRRHRRWLQVVGSGKVVPEPQAEGFYSVAAELGWGRWGALFPRLGEAEAERVAAALVERFRGRDAAPPEPFRGTVVLAPAAAAVLLHEAVAHALEADLLALGGDPEAAVGVRFGSPLLNVLDDPAAAPEPVRRGSDDEGQEVRRRWLLRAGVVAEPLADCRWAGRSDVLAPGACRRADRHHPPSPRSTFLELVPGEDGDGDLLAGAGGGLHLAEAEGGDLDPLTGTFRLRFAGGRRIREGAPAEAVGPCRLQGRVAELLEAVSAVGRRAEPGGAGWCAKDGHKLPVWACCPALRLDGVEVAP
jgi:TldD protein